MFRRLRYFLEMRAPGRPTGPPPASARPWLHPSELPGSFEHAELPPPRRRGSRRLQVAVASASSALLLAGGMLLATPGTSQPAGAVAGPSVATSLRLLPAVDRPAARSMLALVLFEGQHLGAATAMVLPPGDIAITTTPVPPGASVMGRAIGHPSMALQVIGADAALGITVLWLPQTVPVTPTNSLVSSLSTGGGPTSFTALAAVRGATAPVQFEYAPAFLGSVPSATLLGHGFAIDVTHGRALTGTIAGTIVLDAQGDAVAAEVPALGGTDFVSAGFLDLLAQRIVLGHSSGHGWLQFQVCAGTLGTPCSGTFPHYGVVTVGIVAPHTASFGKVHTGDTILAIDSVPVETAADIGSFLYTTSPGQPVDLALGHDGRTVNVIVRLAASP